MQQVGGIVVALHVDGHFEEMPHQPVGLQTVLSPLCVAEQYGGDALRVGVCVAELILHAASLVGILLHPSLPVLVEVILQSVAHVVVYMCRRIGSHQLLTLGNH